MTRVLLVDDSPTFSTSAARFLQSIPGFDVVGFAINGSDALQKVQALNPELVLMDIDMPVMDGLEAGRRIAAQYPHIRIVFVSVNQGKEYQELALQSGGMAFISKSDFVSSLSSLLGERQWFGPHDGGMRFA